MKAEVLDNILDEIIKAGDAARKSAYEMRVIGCNREAELYDKFNDGLREASHIIKKHQAAEIEKSGPMYCEECGSAITGEHKVVKMCPVCGYIQQKKQQA